MKKNLDEHNNIQIVGEYDVIVIGGGFAGVSAALSAKRSGKSTLIIEKSIMLGGLGTLGFIAWYLPLCDGLGRKVTGGQAEELLHTAIKYSYSTLPDAWEKDNLESKNSKGSNDSRRESASDALPRYETRYSVPECVLALDELTDKEGIDVIYDTVFSLPVIENGLCNAIIVEEKGGRVAYKAKQFIDTTGDADLMHRSGVKCSTGKNLLSFWTYITDTKLMEEGIKKNSIWDGIDLRWYGDIPVKPNKYGMYKAECARDVTKFVKDGRKLMLEEFPDGQKDSKSFLAIPGMAQFRTTRCINGEYKLTPKDLNRHHKDSIGVVADWRKPGELYYEIPYRTLVDGSVKNIITAGRTSAAEGDAWEITRVIPSAALTGQAAGLGAVMAIDNNCHIKDISIPEIQERLKETGAIIHF